jgi:hypothetical protein
MCADFVEFVLAAFMGPKGYEPSDAMPGVVTSALAALGLVDAVTAAPVADHHLHEMMGALNLDRLREHIASASTEQLDYGRTAYWAFRQLFPTVLNQAPSPKAIVQRLTDKILANPIDQVDPTGAAFIVALLSAAATEHQSHADTSRS